MVRIKCINNNFLYVDQDHLSTKSIKFIYQDFLSFLKINIIRYLLKN